MYGVTTKAIPILVPDYAAMQCNLKFETSVYRLTVVSDRLIRGYDYRLSLSILLPDEVREKIS